MAAKTPPVGESLRSVINLKLRLPVRTVDEFVSRYGEDVSRTGMRVRTSGSCPVGASVKLDLQFQDGSPLLSGDATVAWSRPPDGVGVQFEKLSPASEIMVEKILELQLDKSPAPRGPKLLAVDVDSGELLSQAGPEEATPAVAMELPAEARRQDRSRQEGNLSGRSSLTPMPVFTGGKAIDSKRKDQTEAPTPASGVTALPEATPAPRSPQPSGDVAIVEEARQTPPKPAAAVASPAAFVKAPVAASAALAPADPPKKNGKVLVMVALALAGIGGVVAVVARGGSKSAPDVHVSTTTAPPTSASETPSAPAASKPAPEPVAAAPAAAPVPEAPEAPAAVATAETHTVAASAPERRERERERENDRRHPAAKNARGNGREAPKESVALASAEKGAPAKAPEVAPPAVAPTAPAVASDAGRGRAPAPSAPAVEAHAAPAATTEPAPIAGGLTHRLGLTSIPSQAEVLIDGQPVGRTPLFGTQVDNTRSHIVTFRKEGYASYEEKISPSSAWTIKVSDRSTAILRISALLKRSP